jgi:tRNA threonylcarbamoyladenosine biosynthesis protein TsaB
LVKATCCLNAVAPTLFRISNLRLQISNLRFEFCNPAIVLILALDTSGTCGSVAVLDDGHLLAEVELPAERRSAQTLAPAIVEVLRQAAIESEQLKLVATTIGPGSFTGLRVGVTTAKTFAYAVNAQVLGVSTLAAIAHQAPAELFGAAQVAVEAVLDAQRKELFVARFQSEAGSAASGLPALRGVEADHIVPADRWLAGLTPGTLVTGAGLQKLLPRLPGGVTALEPVQWQPRAATIGRLAWRDYQTGRRDDLWRLAPVYLRPSYAEEKAAKTK